MKKKPQKVCGMWLKAGTTQTYHVGSAGPGLPTFYLFRNTRRRTGDPEFVLCSAPPRNEHEK